MDASELNSHLHREVDRWAALTYDELRQELTDVVAYDTGTCQVELMLLEDTGEHVHVSVSVDDRTLRRGIHPLTHSFLVNADGRVDR
jgi:hypothetical protein